MNSIRPSADEYAPAFANYVGLVPESDIVSALDVQRADFEALGTRIPSGKEGFRYAEGKWSIIQLLRHMIDAERVMSYRALTFARGDAADLPGFEEDDWAREATAEGVPLRDIIDELVQMRAANVLFFRHLPEPAWQNRGRASEREISVRALAYVLVGHARHHLRVLEERYLNAAS